MGGLLTRMYVSADAGGPARPEGVPGSRTARTHFGGAQLLLGRVLPWYSKATKPMSFRMSLSLDAHKVACNVHVQPIVYPWYGKAKNAFCYLCETCMVVRYCTFLQCGISALQQCSWSCCCSLSWLLGRHLINSV